MASLKALAAYHSDDEAADRVEPSYSSDDDDGGDDGAGGAASGGREEGAELAGTVWALEASRKGFTSFGAVPPELPGTGILPSAASLFTEVAGPPEFLTPKMLGPVTAGPPSAPARAAGAPPVRHTEPQAAENGAPSASRPSNVPPAAAPTAAPAEDGAPGGDGRRVASAAMPPPEDATSLLRVCPSCHVPKTFSHARGGMVCPLCNDRAAAGGGGGGGGEGEPPGGGEARAKRRQGGGIKDKEREKRMKGQSAHATWKSETEMQLRQTYD